MRESWQTFPKHEPHQSSVFFARRRRRGYRKPTNDGPKVIIPNMPTNANRPVRRRKVVSHYSDENPSTFTKKRKGVGGDTSSSSSTTNNIKRKDPPSSCSRKRKSPPTLPHPDDDIAMSHTRVVNPVFPIQELVAGSPSMSNSTHSVLLSASNQLPPKPTWTSLTSHVQDYDPIGTITWLSVRVDREEYAIAGDCHGALALMRNATTIAVIRTTSAAKRDLEREITKRKVYPNAIIQCAWSHGLIALLTKTELELLSVETKSILSTIPIVVDTRKSNIQTPVLSLQKNSLLWTTGQWGLDKVPPGSLLLWEALQPTTNHKPTVLSLDNVTSTRYLAALWEKMESSRSFFCVYQQTDETTGLLRGHSEGSNIVVEHRQSLPSTGRNTMSECTLQQFDDYVFLSGKGVRMYNANNLSFVTTYGENVQLHGKVVVWSRCCWLPAPCTKRNDIRVSKKNCWIEQTDALAEPSIENTDRDYWLMGIPHPNKGPEELRSNLYVWQRGGASTFLKSISKGCASDVWVNRSKWHIVALSAETGDLKQFVDSTTTSFSGVMYPVGFEVITDNIEYIEDEDELDHVLANSEKPVLGLYDKDPILDDDGSPQVKESEKKSVYIDVLADEDSDEDEYPVICWPEADRFDPENADPGSPKRNDRRNPILPQIDAVKHEMVSSNDDETETAKPKPALGKRRLEVIKQSSIDAQLKSQMKMRRGEWPDSKGCSLDPSQLKHSLEEKTLAMELLFLSPGQKRQHVEDDGCGEIMAKDELSCPACLGRMTLHTCAVREMPIDYDALAREELARREREEAEKMRIKTERRKQTELKRKEARKKKKMEEERLRTEQIQAERATAIKQAGLPHHASTSSTIHRPEYTQAPSLHKSRDTIFPPTLKIDGNEVVPSTSLDPTDALSALAGLADSLSTQPFLSDQSNYPQHLADGSHETQLDAMFTILPMPEEETFSGPQTTAPKSSKAPLLDLSHERNDNIMPPPALKPSSTVMSFPTDRVDAEDAPQEPTMASKDITLHTVPGSTLPILSGALIGACGDDTESKQCVEMAPNQLISPTNGTTSGVLSPSGLSAIAMLSETAVRQAILDGEQNGLIPKTQLPEASNGEHETLGTKDKLSDLRAESGSIPTDSQP